MLTYKVVVVQAVLWPKLVWSSSSSPGPQCDRESSAAGSQPAICGSLDRIHVYCGHSIKAKAKIHSIIINYHQSTPTSPTITSHYWHHQSNSNLHSGMALTYLHNYNNFLWVVSFARVIRPAHFVMFIHHCVWHAWVINEARRSCCVKAWIQAGVLVGSYHSNAEFTLFSMEWYSNIRYWPN